MPARGVDYVKTSTGFGYVKQPSGDLQLLRRDRSTRATDAPAHGAASEVKAAGGVLTYVAADSMRRLGATRIGCSATGGGSEGEQARRLRPLQRL